MDRSVIHRIEIPVDGKPHGIDLTGEILHTAARRPDLVDVWYQARPDGMEPMRRSFQAVGTDRPIPAHLGFYVTHKGTAITADGAQVWHLLENHCPHPGIIDTTTRSERPEYGSALCGACSVSFRGDGEGGWIPT